MQRHKRIVPAILCLLSAGLFASCDNDIAQANYSPLESYIDENVTTTVSLSKDNVPDDSTYSITVTYENGEDITAVGSYIFLETYDVVEMTTLMPSDVYADFAWEVCYSNAVSLSLTEQNAISQSYSVVYRLAATESGLAVIRSADKEHYIIIKSSYQGDKKFTTEDLKELNSIDYLLQDAGYSRAVAAVERAIESEITITTIAENSIPPTEATTSAMTTEPSDGTGTTSIKGETGTNQDTTIQKGDSVATTVNPDTITTQKTTTAQKTTTKATTTKTTTQPQVSDEYKLDSTLQAYYNLAHNCASDKDKQIIVDDICKHAETFNGKSGKITLYANSTKKKEITISSPLLLEKDSSLYAWANNTKNMKASNNVYGNANVISSNSTASYAQDVGYSNEAEKAKVAYTYTTAFRNSCIECVDEFIENNAAVAQTRTVKYYAEVYSYGTKTSSGWEKFSSGFLWR